MRFALLFWPLLFVACDQRPIPVSFVGNLTLHEREKLQEAFSVLDRVCGFSVNQRAIVDSVTISRESCIWCGDSPQTDTWSKTYLVAVFINGRAPGQFMHHRMYYVLGLDGESGIVAIKTVAREICEMPDHFIALPELAIIGASIDARSRVRF